MGFPECLSPSHLLKDHKVILHRGVLVRFLVIPANGRGESGTGQSPPHTLSVLVFRGLKSGATIDLSPIFCQRVCMPYLYPGFPSTWRPLSRKRDI